MSGHMRSLRMASITVVALLAMTSMLLLACSRASAEMPLVVYGYVTDNAGNPIEGAPVVVVAMNGETPRTTKNTQTDEDGLYVVQFEAWPLPDEWKIGDTIIATAQWGANQESNQQTLTVDPGGVLQLDIQFPFEIPEFGTVLGFLAAAAIVGAVAVLYLLPKKLKSVK